MLIFVNPHKDVFDILSFLELHVVVFLLKHPNGKILGNETPVEMMIDGQLHRYDKNTIQKRTHCLEGVMFLGDCV